jgi:hypothetical protein
LQHLAHFLKLLLVQLIDSRKDLAFVLQSLLVQLIDLIQGLGYLLGILLRILHTLNTDAASLVDRGVATVF